MPRRPLTGDKVYPLNEGFGLWVFAIVASEQPLPAYWEWLEQRFNNSLDWEPVTARSSGHVGAGISSAC